MPLSPVGVHVSAVSVLVADLNLLTLFKTIYWSSVFVLFRSLTDYPEGTSVQFRLETILVYCTVLRLFVSPLLSQTVKSSETIFIIILLIFKEGLSIRVDLGSKGVLLTVLWDYSWLFWFRLVLWKWPPWHRLSYLLWFHIQLRPVSEILFLPKLHLIFT